MADTTFVPGTVIQSAWLNDVNDSVYAGTPASGTLRYEVFGRTAQEITAGVTPANYAYSPGDVRRYGAVGDGFTDNTTAITNAIAATIEGGILLFPAAPGAYRYTQLTINKTITIKGQGWHCGLKEVFGSNYDANTSGSVLRSTKTTAGASIISQTGNKGPKFEDIAVLGPGSGTSTGIAFGSGSGSLYQILGQWQNVLLANWYDAMPLQNVEDYTFLNLRVRGCVTGITLNAGGVTTNTTQDVFINLEVQKCTTGLLFTDAACIQFVGGLFQGNTDAIVFRPSVTGAVGGLEFNGQWFETNTRDIVTDLTNKGITHLAFKNLTMQQTNDFWNLTNPNNMTITYVSFDNCAASGKALDFSPGASVGPAFNKIVLLGANEFASKTIPATVSVIDLSDNQIKNTVATGTAPLVISSTTPVNNLTCSPPVYASNGTQRTNMHIVVGANSLSAGSVVVTLSGAAVFSSTNYYVMVTNQSALNPCSVTYTSGSSFTINGTGTDNVRWIAVGPN